MLQTIINNSYFLIVITFLIDVLSEPFFGIYFIESLLAYLIFVIFFKFNKNSITFALILISIKSFLKYDNCTIIIVPLILLILLIYKTKHFFYNPEIIAAFYMVLYLIFQVIFINWFILKTHLFLSNIIIYIPLNSLITYFVVKSIKPSTHTKA